MRLSEIKLLGRFDDINLNVINSQFQADIKNRVTFFPWGKFGKGYRISNPNQERKIRDFLINYYRLPIIFMFSEYLLLSAFASLKIYFLILMISLLVWLLVCYAILKKLTKDLRYSTAKYHRIR